MNAAPQPDVLTVSVAGFEGPLDLLLALARARRIDLKALPILPLVDQYLAFIAQARRRVEVAADHLVMAAWLAYLKSALLLPPAERPDPDPEELAARIQHRLRRLDAMRDAAAALAARDRLGRDVWMRGTPEGLRTLRRSRHEASLYDLIAAYAAAHARRRAAHYTPHARQPVVTLEEALARMNRLLGTMQGWAELARFLPPAASDPLRRSAVASGLLAALELARQGRAELAQSAPFAPLLLRSKR